MTRTHVTAAAVVVAAVLTVAGCQIRVEGDPPLPDPTPKPSGPQTPGPNKPTSKSPSPKTSSGSPKPWVPPGRTAITGCESHPPYGVCTIQGVNFKPGERILITFDGSTVSDSVRADGTGRFEFTRAHLPSVGRHTYTARGVESGVAASTTVLMTPR